VLPGPARPRPRSCPPRAGQLVVARRGVRPRDRPNLV